jgi:hypothetical protein
MIALWGSNCAMYYSNTMIKVVISIDTADDDAGHWIHMSVSRMGRIPSWDELKKAKETFFGNRPAIQLFPPKESWLNIAECLHLFSRLDADTVPPQIWMKDDATS